MIFSDRIALGQILVKGDSGSGCVTAPPAGATYAQQSIVSVTNTCFRTGNTNTNAFCSADPVVFARFEAWDIVTPTSARAGASAATGSARATRPPFVEAGADERDDILASSDFAKLQ